jgi:hypothetical protein
LADAMGYYLCHSIDTRGLGNAADYRGILLLADTILKMYVKTANDYNWTLHRDRGPSSRMTRLGAMLDRLRGMDEG